MLGTIGAVVVDRELPVPHAHERFDSAGKLTDDDVRAELADILRELVAAMPRRAVA